MPVTGRSRSHRRLTVDWLHPNIAPVAAWVTLRRISMTTMTSELKGLTFGGFFAPGLTKVPLSPARTMMLSLVSCPQDRPVRE